MADNLTVLFGCKLRKETIPEELQDASIIHLYKRKGTPQTHDNYSTEASIAWKILAKLLDHMGLIPESL